MCVCVCVCVCLLVCVHVCVTEGVGGDENKEGKQGEVSDLGMCMLFCKYVCVLREF